MSTPPYPFTHPRKRTLPGQMAEILTSVSCSSSNVSKSMPVWYPVNFSGLTGEFFGVTKMPKGFLVTRSRAREMGGRNASLFVELAGELVLDEGVREDDACSVPSIGGAAHPASAITKPVRNS